MKYLLNGEKGKRRSKTNLTKGAFGASGNKKVKNMIWKKFGVNLPLATKKGKIPSTYSPYKTNKNKYTPNSKGRIKKNEKLS